MEDSLGKLVTKFLLDTCRLCPPPTKNAVLATEYCASAATLHTDEEPDTEVYLLTTGSAAEFHIEPMLSCVGDIDVMYHLGTELAIPAGHPPPTQLPADFHSSYVRLYDIEDSAWPGYVHLRLRGLLTERNDENKYAFWPTKHLEPCVSNDIFGGTVEMHGPARKAALPYGSSAIRQVTDNAASMDVVYCVRCLEWPPQAADWPTRHRNYGWPDSATVGRVTSIGCDVVGVAHGQCKQHEWEGKRQWRLSFSRAEVALLNSWTPVQQIVYHMLRVFSKMERLTEYADNDGAKLLSNYHIKTLMLWACETKPRDWWTDDLNAASICTTLLHILAAWIRDAHCPHYFVTRCSLLDHDKSSAIANGLPVAWKLITQTETTLSMWFVGNYILKCADAYIEISPHMLMFSAIAHCRHKLWLKEYFSIFDGALHGIMDILNYVSLTGRVARCWLKELSKLQHSYVTFFTAVVFLHLARLSADIEQRRSEFVDMLATLCLHLNGRDCKYHRTPQDITQIFNVAALFLKLTVKTPVGTLAQIQNELPKALLQEVLKYKRAPFPLSHDSLLSLSNVYLSVLCYTTGQYQTAANHCALVAKTTDCAQSCSHVVEAELLPKIDDDVDNVLGLAAFYEYVRTAAIKVNQRKRYVGVFDVKLFAHFLQVKCAVLPTTRLIEQLSAVDAMCQYQKHANSLKEMFLTDILLLKILLKHRVEQQLAAQSRIKVTTENAPDLSQLLVQSAFEYLIKFRQLEVLEFGSVVTIVTTDFEALYAYRCGEYQHCLQLCRQNVRTLIGADYMTKVILYPGFIQLMDDDIVSLVGLTLIANRDCRDDSNIYKSNKTNSISQLTLSLYLLTQCQLKLRNSVTSLIWTVSCIECARQGCDKMLDRWTLRLAERKLEIFLTS